MNQRACQWCWAAIATVGWLPAVLWTWGLL